MTQITEMENAKKLTEVYNIELRTGNPECACYKVYKSFLEEKVDAVGGTLEVHESETTDMHMAFFYQEEELKDIVGVPFYENLTQEEKETFDTGHLEEVSEVA